MRIASYLLIGLVVVPIGASCRRAAEDPTSAPIAVDRSTTGGNPGPASGPPSPSAGRPEMSWDTEDDRAFARFLQANSGGMIAKAAVGIAREGVIRVVLDRSVAPEDTLHLTRSVLAGARRDFPGKPIALKVYDPAEELILTARYRPDRGVDYQLAGSDRPLAGPDRTTPSTVPAAPARPEDSRADEPAGRGASGRDRDFALWAERIGGAYLSYVQADLERHGRLWFGVTRQVKPDDVPELTRSLLEGARTEFPDRPLQAVVFDLEGERIGTAALGPDGKVNWSR